MTTTSSCAIPFVCCLVALLILSSLQAQAQPGFLSVDCGGLAGYTSEEGINWETDELVNVDHGPGVAAQLGSDGNLSSLPRELQSLRYFPASLSSRRSCYTLAVASESDSETYLFRAGFLYGNYDLRNKPPSFLVSLDMDYWSFLQLTSGVEPVYLETITAIAASTLTFCLIRLQDTDPPLVNSIELRLLPPGSYRSEPKAGAYVEGGPLTDSYYNSVARVNFGGPSLRYPHDPYDRIWKDYRLLFPELKELSVLTTSLPVNVSTVVCAESPPEAAMQTAVTAASFNFTLDMTPQLLAGAALDVFTNASFVTAYPTFFFAEIGNLTSGLVRSVRFFCTPLWKPLPGNSAANVTPAFTALEFIGFLNASTRQGPATCHFEATVAGGLDPILNAIDFYTVQNKELDGTSGVDVQALSEVKEEFYLNHVWFGDPCLPTPWDEVECEVDGAAALRVISLNLAGRNLTGSIPSSIASMTSLTYLNISNNNISGSFPGWLGSQLHDLKSLDVSNNEITGTYPQTLVTTLGSNFRFGGNSGLCSSDGSGCDNQGVARIKIISFSLAATVFLVGLIMTPLLYCVLLPHSSKNGLFDKRYRQLQSRLKQSGARTKPFSYYKVKCVTKKFETKIGEGGFGPVYYGKLKDNQEVAVKVLSRKSRQGKKEFHNEIELLSTVHHKCLVSLLGYCQSWRKQILIYEYMRGGDLSKRLHGPSASSNPLTWIERCSIMLEVAEGLEYLHHGCKPAIIHRDVKSNNILLTERTTAKLADFGLSKQLDCDEEDATHVTTDVKGTTGYLDPEYYITNKLTEKSDVYAFGVLLMEALSGRAIVDRNIPSEHMFIVDWVRQAWKANDLEQLVDVNLAGSYDKAAFSGLANLALWCVERASIHRPPMAEVLKQLRVMGLERSEGIASVKNQGLQPESIVDFLSSLSESVSSSKTTSSLKPTSSTASASSSSAAQPGFQFSL